VPRHDKPEASGTKAALPSARANGALIAERDALRPEVDEAKADAERWRLVSIKKGAIAESENLRRRQAEIHRDQARVECDALRAERDALRAERDALREELTETREWRTSWQATAMDAQRDLGKVRVELAAAKRQLADAEKLRAAVTRTAARPPARGLSTTEVHPECDGQDDGES
jgi:chromosome segregation ATPase